MHIWFLIVSHIGYHSGHIYNRSLEIPTATSAPDRLRPIYSILWLLIDSITDWNVFLSLIDRIRYRWAGHIDFFSLWRNGFLIYTFLISLGRHDRKKGTTELIMGEKIDTQLRHAVMLVGWIKKFLIDVTLKATVDQFISIIHNEGIISK